MKDSSYSPVVDNLTTPPNGDEDVSGVSNSIEDTMELSNFFRENLPDYDFKWCRYFKIVRNGGGYTIVYPLMFEFYKLYFPEAYNNFIKKNQ